MHKPVAITLVIIALIGLAWYGASRYLVSRLDGTGGVHAPADRSQLFSSPAMGLAFSYGEAYEATTTEHGTDERMWHTVVLLPKGYKAPEGGEGPPAITVSDFPNPEHLSLEEWVLGDARSNWKLAAQDGGLGSTTVAATPGLMYLHSGLYETDAVAVARGDKVYLFEAGWQTPEDQIRKDFDTLLSTVTWLN